MKFELKNIIKSIKYGPHFKSVEKGSVQYLKGNHFNDEYELAQFEYSYVNEKENFEKHLLVKNDVIIAAKGFRNYAWRYTIDQGLCIASSLFFVIKLKEDVVSSKYFTLLMNSPKMLHILKTISKGITTLIIPKNELLKIKIDVPTFERQKEIILINNLMKKEIQLEKKILKQKKILQNSLIDLLIKNELPTNKKVL